MRTHCFITTTAIDARGARWTWHTMDEMGVSRRHSAGVFDTFQACVDDALANGYAHVEVPVLHWSAAAVADAASEGPAPATPTVADATTVADDAAGAAPLFDRS